MSRERESRLGEGSGGRLSVGRSRALDGFGQDPTKLAGCTRSVSGGKRRKRKRKKEERGETVTSAYQ